MKSHLKNIFPLHLTNVNKRIQISQASERAKFEKKKSKINKSNIKSVFFFSFFLHLNVQRLHL